MELTDRACRLQIAQIAHSMAAQVAVEARSRDLRVQELPHLRHRRRLLVKMDQHGRTPFRMSLRTDLALKRPTAEGKCDLAFFVSMPCVGEASAGCMEEAMRLRMTDRSAFWSTPSLNYSVAFYGQNLIAVSQNRTFQQYCSWTRRWARVTSQDLQQFASLLECARHFVNQIKICTTV